MDRRLIRASQRLSEPRIVISVDGYLIEVFWFRAMIKNGGDWFIRRHAHSTYEFHFCAQGECLVETDTASFRVEEGFFYLSSPGVYHVQRPANSGEFVEYSLNCNIRRLEGPRQSVGKELEQVLALFSSSPCFPAADRFGAAALFNQALEEAEQRRLGFEWSLHSLVPRILVAAARAIELELSPVKAAASPAEDYRMARIEEYVRGHIREALSPKDLAGYMNLSEKQVSRIVFAHKGFPAKKFITRIKLEKAKELLASTDMPIKEIAAGLGFSNEYYFSAVFKLHVGAPPGMFRDSMKLDAGGEVFPIANVQKS
ncbi:MAG: AraC family transcriptional regulator [Treponema sp.]|jgi:AraC-like DNA-binding protein|nr:AraC family transcriptional regulator [Treponema sp.]